MRSILTSLALVLALGSGTEATAQTCQTVTVNRSNVPTRSIVLRDREGNVLAPLAVAKLPAKFRLTACTNDAVYVRLEADGEVFWVRRSDFEETPGLAPSDCICTSSLVGKPAAGARPPLGAPMLSDIFYCPVGTPKCAR